MRGGIFVLSIYICHNTSIKLGEIILLIKLFGLFEFSMMTGS